MSFNLKEIQVHWHIEQPLFLTVKHIHALAARFQIAPTVFV